MEKAGMEVKIRLSPAETGKLYMCCAAFEDELKRIADAIHYPQCWDEMTYPTLLDAVKEIGCSACQCAES